jgi:tetraacyldisaccharide 4'-kinase
MMVSNMLPGVPVIIGRNRLRAWTVFSSLGFPQGNKPTDIILDDGFQHLSIHRDVDIVLMTSKAGVSKRESICLPAGNLREPLSALQRATHLVTVVGRSPGDDSAFTRGEKARIRYGELLLMNKLDVANELGLPPSLPLRPMAVCGIARPEPFFEALAARGIVPANKMIVRDHSKFDPGGLRQCISRDIAGSSRPCDAVVTTAKDFWRDPQILLALGVPVWILPMSVEFPYHKLISPS